MSPRKRSGTSRLVLFTRFPVAGEAKTRLIPAIGAEGASLVHQQLTERTLEKLRHCTGQVEVHYSGGDVTELRNWLGEAIFYVEQPEGDLTVKLVAAIDPAPVIFFGSDTPDIEAHHVEAAITALQSHDVVIGPAEDGGYYLIGINKGMPFLFADIEWSTDRVLSETLDRAKQNNLSVKILETLSDCDTPEDLARWPWLSE